MFSGRPKYQTSSATEDFDDEEDDDEVEGVEMPSPPKQDSKPKLPPGSEASKASSSGRLISATLEQHWKEQGQRETTPTAAAAPNTTLLSEARGQLQKPQKSKSVGGKTPARDSPASDYSTRRVRIQEAESGDGDYDDSEDDGSAIVVESHGVSRLKKEKQRPEPSSLIKHHNGISLTTSKPFSKRDLLRPFEGPASDSDEVMQERDELFGEDNDNGSDDLDEMDEDTSLEASIREDIDEEESDDATDELVGIGSRRIPGASQSSPPQRLQNSRAEEDSDDSEGSENSDDSEDSEDSENGIKTPTKTGVSNVDLTPRRSMANPNLLQEDPDELERQEERAKLEIVKEVLNRHAEVAAKKNFDIVVTMPNYEDVADHLFNPDEWEAVAIDWRWTGDDGHVTYQIIYKDGHTRIVEANEILDHIESQVLEDFENDLFAKEENPETWYYPNFRAPGGAFAGGTGITSGAIKRRGRRTESKIYLDNSYRLGMPEEFNIPLTDSSEEEEDVEEEEEEMAEGAKVVPDIAGVRGPILASQYDKFDITDAEILATIQENESDNESWDGGKPSGRGRPRGRPSTSTRAQTMVRTTRAAAKRARGRPPLTPTRGTSNSTPVQPRPPVKSNVVKASATSRGRGRPRGSKNTPRILSSPASSREDSPLSLTVIPKPASVRGRPKGSKNAVKSIISNTSNNTSETSSLSEFPITIKPITPVRPIDVSKHSTPKPVTKSAPSTPKRTLKPTRTLKPPGTPSGARGPGRPPKLPKQEDRLIEETIRTGGANISSTAASLSNHRRTLSATGPAPTAADPERPKKRRRIRFGRDGPEEVSDDDSPPRKTVQGNLPTPQKKPKQPIENPHKPKSPHTSARTSDSDNEKRVFRHEVDRIINKMLLDGAPAYHVQLCGSGPIKPTMWVRLENLQSKSARRKVKEFEAELIQRENEAKLARDRINAQLQRDRQRLAEREAQILGTKSPGRPPKSFDEEEMKEREKEEQRQREKIARRLAMQETLFTGT
ncbi:hypothetical protein TWF506_006145 [Arthrobotrys conoides]|uniref:Uncharacterized protein n=1 Tax=Arthrobotrys conoides TaxID=74498 RepID=A0AAN8NGC0_9PEZI